MNATEARKQIESDFSWRCDEIQFLESRLIGLDEDSSDKYRKSLVVVLYSHFEGYVKLCFEIYLDAVRTAAVPCENAHPSLAVFALSDLFSDVRSGQRKCPLFTGKAPDEKGLNRFYIEREFAAHASEFLSRTVVPPEDFTDDSENVTPTRFAIYLYRLGLPETILDSEVKGCINQLIRLRNHCAHGSMRRGIAKERYAILKKSVLKAMRLLRDQIVTAIANRAFEIRRAP